MPPRYGHTRPHPAANPPTTSPLQFPPPQLAVPAPTFRKLAESAAATAAATRRRHHHSHPAVSPPLPPSPTPTSTSPPPPSPSRRRNRRRRRHLDTTTTAPTLPASHPPRCRLDTIAPALCSKRTTPAPTLPWSPSYYKVAACTFISYIILH